MPCVASIMAAAGTTSMAQAGGTVGEPLQQQAWYCQLRDAALDYLKFKTTGPVGPSSVFKTELEGWLRAKHPEAMHEAVLATPQGWACILSQHPFAVRQGQAGFIVCLKWEQPGPSAAGMAAGPGAASAAGAAGVAGALCPPPFQAAGAPPEASQGAFSGLSATAASGAEGEVPQAADAAAEMMEAGAEEVEEAQLQPQHAQGKAPLTPESSFDMLRAAALAHMWRCRSQGESETFVTKTALWKVLQKRHPEALQMTEPHGGSAQGAHPLCHA